MLYERVKVKGRLDGKKGYGRKKEEITGEPHEKKGDKIIKDQGGRPCK